MHELAITKSLVDCVCENMGEAHVVRVVVEIGKQSAVMADAVRGCFVVCAMGTPLEGAELENRRARGRRAQHPRGGGDLDMCATCGCGNAEGHAHEHPHRHDNHHDHDHDVARVIRLERQILEKNDAHARANRAWLARRNVVAFNLVSSPGAGKTTLLEATLRGVKGRAVVSVIEGDQETEHDAARIRAAGGRALQLNTGTGCHLDAHSVGHALEELDPPARSLVLIENVGNLVCPALFDLGERAKNHHSVDHRR